MYRYSQFFICVTGHCFDKLNLPDVKDLQDLQGHVQRSEHSNFSKISQKWMKPLQRWNFPWFYSRNEKSIHESMCVRFFILVSLTPYKQFPKFPILKLLESKQCVMFFAWERLEKFPFLTDSQHLQSSPYLFGAGRSGKLFLTVLLILPLFLPKQWGNQFCFC